MAEEKLGKIGKIGKMGKMGKMDSNYQDEILQPQDQKRT